MKNSGTNNFKKFITKNYKLLIMFIGFTLLNLFFLYWNFKLNNLTFGKTFIFMLIGSILLEVIICTIILIAKKKTWKIEKIFLILGLIISLIYVFVLPVSRAPDEESHFFRIYEITTGHIISDTSKDADGDNIRGSVEASNIEIVRDFKENNVKYADIINALSIYPNNEEQSFVKTSAGGYNPISYTPHIIGMAIGEALHLPFLITAYIAKLFHCITCIIIIYFSIKFIPFLKEFVFFIAFLPITMQAMTSLSADGFIIAIAIAFISFVLYATYSVKDKLNKKHLLFILLACLTLSLSKMVYAFLCLLLFTIPKERFGDQKRKLITIFTIGGICFTVLLVWILLSASLSGSVDPYNRNLLISNPPMYGVILLKTLSTHLSLYLFGTLGGYLEWFNVTLSPLYLFPSLFIAVLLCKKAAETWTANKSLRILSTVIFFVIVLSTFTAMFTEWTHPGETIIDGVQGRYFLPILLLIPLALMQSDKNNNSNKTSASKPSTKNTTVTKKIPTLKQNYYLYGFYVFESIYAIITISCTHL